MSKKDYYEKNNDIISNKAKNTIVIIEMRCQTDQRNII